MQSRIGLDLFGAYSRPIRVNICKLKFSRHRLSVRTRDFHSRKRGFNSPCRDQICCLWCNGSTADCGSVSDGSNPSVQPKNSKYSRVEQW